MKKFYSIIAAATLGSMISASAFTLQTMPKEKLAFKQQAQINKVDAQLLKNDYRGAVSREADDDSIRISKFTEMVYFDYFYVFTKNGQQRPADERKIYNRSSMKVAMYNNFDGTLTVDGFGSLKTGFPAKFNFEIAQDGSLSIPLGQIIAEGVDDYGAPYKLALAGINDNGDAQVTGSISSKDIEVYADAIGVYEYLGIVDADDPDGGWYFLGINVLFERPNALLEYTLISEDEYGNVSEEQISNEIVYYQNDADPSEDPNSIVGRDRFWFSNFMPENEGVGVFFYPISETLMWSDDPVIYPSLRAQSSWTGEFDMVYGFEEEGVYYPSWLGVMLGTMNIGANENYDLFNLPEGNEELGIPMTNRVMCFSEPDAQGRGYVLWEGKNITIKTYINGEIPENGEQGIKDIITDNSGNASTVYYNLQGVEVSNPTAGQIYIVKNGNKVSKQIIK